MKLILSILLTFYVSHSFSKSDEKQITIYDDEKQTYTEEKIYGGDLLYWLYNSKLGKVISKTAVKPFWSKLTGSIQNGKASRKKIKKFITDFHIRTDEYQAGSKNVEGIEFWKSFKNFNEFFMRKFKPGMRLFPEAPIDFPAFVEARYLILENLDDNSEFPVKGKFLNSKALLKNEKWQKEFKDSVIIIGRLNPTDYHRFHFPDNGRVLDEYRINGNFHSVNPIALNLHDEVFSENERHVTILETENFGKIAYIEVGAMMVGKIIQTYEGLNFKKGQEKGTFKFGASTVIVLVKKGIVEFSKDVVERSENERVETLIKLGTKIGVGHQ